MDDLRFYVLFNSISVISGRCSDDDERLCAMELRFTVQKEITSQTDLYLSVCLKKYDFEDKLQSV